MILTCPHCIGTIENAECRRASAWLGGRCPVWRCSRCNEYYSTIVTREADEDRVIAIMAYREPTDAELEESYPRGFPVPGKKL